MHNVKIGKNLEDGEAEEEEECELLLYYTIVTDFFEFCLIK